MVKKTTKDLLAESFLELAEKKRIDKITITEITSNCGMSQPTFYNHFSDKYDLILWIHTVQVEKVMSKIGVNDYCWKDTLLDGAKYYYSQKEYIVNALKHTNGQNSFAEYVQNTNINLLTKEVRKKINASRIPSEILAMIKIYVYGTVHFMVDWLLGKIKLTPEQMAEIWEESLPEPLKQYLY